MKKRTTLPLCVKSAKNAEHYQWGGACDGWHLVKTDALSIIQERVPPNCHEVMHLHRYASQFFFVLSGIATLIVGEQRYLIHSNEGLFIEPGTAHQLKNEQDVDLTFLVTSSPPSHGDRVEV